MARLAARSAPSTTMEEKARSAEWVDPAAGRERFAASVFIIGGEFYSKRTGWQAGEARWERLKLSARSADSLSARIEALQCSRGQAVRAPGLEGLADSFNRTRA